MAMVSGAKRKRGPEEDKEKRLDRFSALPNDVLGDIVSLLPTNDGARTQVLSSSWRQIWRSAPLNLTLDPSPNAPLGANRVSDSLISRILSKHQGPGCRFSIPDGFSLCRAPAPTSLNRWLESPALNGLQELEFHYKRPQVTATKNLVLPPPPESLHRFSSTLRVACFGCCGFPDGNGASGLRFPVLTQLTLSHVVCSESSLHALLAACPVLQSFLLIGSIGCPRVQISCPTLRSIGLRSRSGPIDLQLRQLIIEDAPSLERLLCFGVFEEIAISVISAPKLHVLGELSAYSPRLQIGSTIFQGSRFISLKMVVHSVKILSLIQEHLSLDLVIEFMKWFPCLEKLYIQTEKAGEKNVWCHKYKNLIGTLDIRLKEIVLAGYRGNTSHAKFAKFFVLNARMLESMKLETIVANPSNAWIEKQHRLLQTKNKASSDMQLDFVSAHGCRWSNISFRPDRVHDLSTADPFP